MADTRPPLDDVEFQVYRIDGAVHLTAANDEGGDYFTLSPTDAWLLGNALVKKSMQKEDDPITRGDEHT